MPQLSPFTTAVASGSIRVVGELADVDHLLVDGTVDTLDMRLFDYARAERRADPASRSINGRSRSTSCSWSATTRGCASAGTVGLQRRAHRAAGGRRREPRHPAGLLPRRARARAAPSSTAAIDGPLREPVFSGSATITDGRIRHFSLPNSLDAINGTIRFDAGGIRLDDVTATMGGGRVQFGGRIGFDGYLPGELNVTVRGEDMHLRYPGGRPLGRSTPTCRCAATSRRRRSAAR